MVTQGRDGDRCVDRHDEGEQHAGDVVRHVRSCEDAASCKACPRCVRVSFGMRTRRVRTF
jgi:hypothetical protein